MTLVYRAAGLRLGVGNFGRPITGHADIEIINYVARFRVVRLLV